MSLQISCVEPLEIELTDKVRLLVVEGLVSDQPGPYQVKLTWSQPVDTNFVEPVTQATVRILEEGGPSELLIENEPGIYQTTNLQGIPGKRYKLEIQIDNSRQYESPWQLLKVSPPIDSIYYEYAEKNIIGGLLRGIEVKLDTKDPEGKSQFYRWSYEETWRYRVPYPPLLEYFGNNQAVALTPDKEYCFQFATSDEINIGTSVDNSDDVIKNHLVKYVTTETERLQVKYSILVKQHVLEEEEFLFWKSLKESAEDVGGLYDRQPQSLTGNITSITDPKEPVLGYFSVNGIKEKRIFIDPNYDLPREALPPDRLGIECLRELDSIPATLDDVDILIFQALDAGKVFYNFYGMISIEGYLITTVPCSDCTYYGGTVEKPDYWID
ncbi:MAG: DUF4249 domain-containing protein [Bacteroidetes bacterium]|nr:DUF4249 domain-containing protein [Bacteroidota bacterium]